MQGFLNDYTLGKQDAKEKEPLCDHCEEKIKAANYCPVCSKYLCVECLKAHSRLAPYRNHKTVNVTSEELSIVKQQAKRVYYCSLHPEEQLKLYCRKCQCVACILCFVNTHNGHDIGSIDTKVRKEAQTILKGLIKEADTKLTEFEQNLQYISAVEKNKCEQTAPLKAQIDKEVDSLIAQLEARRAELHKEVDTATTTDQKELWAQKEYHETNIVGLKGALSFARRSLNCEEDTELLTLCSQVSTRLKVLSQLKWDSQPTEEIEMTVRKFEETSSSIASWSLKLKKNQLVGEVRTNTSKPALQLIVTPNHVLRSARIEQGRSMDIQIEAVVKINGNQTCKGANLTCSAYYIATHHRGYYGNQEVDLPITIKGNNWTTTFTPSNTGHYRITFVVQGTYGKEILKDKCSYNVEVEQKPPLPANSQYQKPPLPANSQYQKPLQPANSQYQKPLQPANSQYQKPLQPANSQYQKPLQPANSQYQKTLQPANSQYQKPLQPANSQYQKPLQPANSQYQTNKVGEYDYDDEYYDDGLL